MPDGQSGAFATIFSCRPAMDAARFVLRGRAPALAAAMSCLGMEPPPALRAQQSQERSLLWLGPDEYLLLAPPDQAGTLAETLEQAMAPYPHSLVDVSDRQLGFEVSGSPVEAVLNAGCPLDLSIRAFPVGMCTRTVFAKSEITLWRRDEPSFHIEVWRSFAPYFLAYLDVAARGG